MSAASALVQVISNLNLSISCGNAATAFVVYDWLLCLNQEITLIWNWHSKFTASTFVYVFSRYAVLIELILAIATNLPMSNLSCTAVIWAQTITEILGITAFSAFSAMRAYALSNRNIWLTAIIILLALPPPAMFILLSIYQDDRNMPSPFNCGASIPLSPTSFITVVASARASQIAAELLAIGITSWYTYQSYRIRAGIKVKKSISSVLLYNGSLYFAFLTSLCILDIILQVHSIRVDSAAVTVLNTIFGAFYDPICSILTCRFMISLRQFDSTIASVKTPVLGSGQLREHMASAVLEFGAQPSTSLPSFIASFAHPVHVDSVLSDMDPGESVDNESDSEQHEVDVVETALETPSEQILPARNQLSAVECSV